MVLSTDITILFGDIRVVFMNMLMPEGDQVYVLLPDGFSEHNDTVWCLKRVNGLKDASLLHEHFTAVLLSRLVSHD